MSTKESDTKSLPCNTAPIKILPTQLTRLKKVEEEETWISGEELYTEGSSDEENCRFKSTSSDKTSDVESTTLQLVTKVIRPKSKSDTKKKSNGLLSAAHGHNTVYAQPEGTSTNRFSLLVNKVSDEDDEDSYRADDEISWKANRGSGAPEMTNDRIS